MFAILMAEKMSGTSVKIIKNEVGCRDDTVPKTVENKKALRGGLRACNTLPQPPPYIFGFWGLRKSVACSQSSSQCLLVSTVFGTVSSLHPTSFLMIFTLVYVGMARTCICLGRHT